MKGLRTRDIFWVSAGLPVCCSTTGSALMGVGAQGLGFVAVVLVAMTLYSAIAANYAEMVTTFPTAECLRDWVGRAFGETAGTAASMVYLLPFIFGAPAEMAFFGHIMNGFVPAIAWQVWAVGTITVFGLIINLFGIVGVGRVQRLLVFYLLVIGAGLTLSAIFGWSLVRPDWARAVASHADLGGLASVFLIAMWIFAGFEVSAALSEECMRPERAIPRGMLGGIAGVAIFSVVFSISGLVLVDDVEKLSTSQVFAALGSSWLGRIGALLFFLFALAATSSSVLPAAASNSRLLMGLARPPHNMLPRCLSWLHPRFRTPWISLGLVWAVNVSLILGLGSNMTTLIYLSSFLFVVEYLLVLATNIRLRTKAPNARRPYRVPGGPFRVPLISALAFVVMLCFLILSVVPPYGTPKILYYGTSALVVLGGWGVLWHVASRRGKRHRPPDLEPSPSQAGRDHNERPEAAEELQGRDISPDR